MIGWSMRLGWVATVGLVAYGVGTVADNALGISDWIADAIVPPLESRGSVPTGCSPENVSREN